MEESHHNRLFRLVPIAVFVFTFSVYLSTLSPTIGFIDSGELTAVSHGLGIAHPTGYPVYTLLGRLFTLIPVGEVAWRLNLSSAVYAALSAALLSLAFLTFGDPVGGTAVPLLFAFSSTLWSQATQAEVYSLTVLLSTILLCLAVSRGPAGRGILLLSFAVGVALTNHMSVLALAVPTVIYLLFTRRKLVNGRTILLSVLLFLLGLSIYLYLPVRSARDPVLNWGDPKSLVNLFRHVSGKQYRVWMFSSSLTLLRSHFGRFLRLLIQQFTPFLLPFSLVGILAGFRRRAWFGGLPAAIFLLDLVYINYEIPDIDPYFLPAFMVMAVWIGAGMSASARLFKERFPSRRLLSHVLSVVLIVLSLIPLFAHYPERNRTGDYIAYDYGVDVLRSVETNGICITNDWDIYSPILYLRKVQGIRRDAVMIDKELLRRSWYFGYLEKEYPWLIERSEREVQSYLELLAHFENGTLKDPKEIQERFIVMINSFISRNLPERAVCLTFTDGFDRDAPRIGEDYLKVPYGLVYRLGGEPEEFDYQSLFPRGGLDPSVRKDERTALKLSAYPRMVMERAVFEMRRNRFARAIPLLRDGLKWNWQPALFHRDLGMCYMGMGNYKRAWEEFAAVLAIDPQDKRAQQAMAAVEEILRQQRRK